MGLFPEWNIMHELLIYWANQARLESIGFFNSLQHTDEIAKTRGGKKKKQNSLNLKV
jgi:hypothetical protein